MVLFTPDVKKKIKGVAHKDSDIDVMCQRGLSSSPNRSVSLVTQVHDVSM